VSASEEAYRGGDIPKAVQLAVEALELETSCRPQAQKALTDALGVYDLSDSFRDVRVLALPSAPIKTALSPNGSRAAALAGSQILVFDTDRGNQLIALTAEPSALSDFVFSGEDTLLYAGKGALRACDLTTGQEIWSGQAATGITLSADGSTVAAIYKDAREAAVYHAKTGEILRTVSFGERQQPIPANDVFADLDLSLFQLSGDGSWLAVSFSNGGLEVFDIKHGQRDLRILENSEYARFEGGFFGPYFAFSAARDGESVFAVIDMEAGIQTGGFQAPNAFHVQAGETGICVSMENTLVKLDPVTGDQQELAYTRQGITSFARNGRHTLTLLADGSAAFYDENGLLLDELAMMCTFGDVAGEFALIGNRDVPSLRLLRLKTHPEDFS